MSSKLIEAHQGNFHIPRDADLDGHFGIVPGHLIVSMLAPKYRDNLRLTMRGMLRADDRFQIDPETGTISKKDGGYEEIGRYSQSSGQTFQVLELCRAVDEILPNPEELEWQSGADSILPHREDFALIEQFARFNPSNSSENPTHTMARTTFTHDSPFKVYINPEEPKSFGFVAEFAAQTGAISALDPQLNNNPKLVLLENSEANLLLDPEELREGDILEAITLSTPENNGHRKFGGDIMVYRFSSETNTREPVALFSLDGRIISAKIAKRLGLTLPKDF